MMRERLLRQSFLHSTGCVTPQGLFLTYFYCSVSHASLLCTGICWAPHRCHTGHSWVRRQLWKINTFTWFLDISSRDSHTFGLPVVSHDGLVLAQAAALKVNLCLCTECSQSPETVYTHLFTCKVWLSPWPESQVVQQSWASTRTSVRSRAVPSIPLTKCSYCILTWESIDILLSISLY